MSLFYTYYENAPISFFSKIEEEFLVNKLLENTKLKHFFDENKHQTFVAPDRVNNLRHINDYFQEVNCKLQIGDNFFIHFETFTSRRNRLWINKIPIIRSIYFFFEFIFNRIIPKIKYLNSVYFFLTKGKNRLLSKAEVMGRLLYNGFELKQAETIDGICYIKAQKVKSEIAKNTTSYGLIFKMKRVGKNGELFNIYKFRTMHPYSEYIQNYVMKELGFADSGKFERDFRITPWGKWMRKYWIDEIPQILNVLKGDMKLVGVRPVSESYFNILPKKIQEKRVKYKPGCIPPYVSMNFKSSLKEVITSEYLYLKIKEKNPYTTDLKFFFYALFNIIFKGKRSS